MASGVRMIVKAVIWQLMGLATMVAVGFLVTGSLRIGGTLALANALIGLASYLLYEWLWDRIPWGRQQVKAAPPARRAGGSPAFPRAGTGPGGYRR